jgi:hypothetical protein
VPGTQCTQPACRIDGCRAAKQARALAHYSAQAALTTPTPRMFSTVYCSQCGAEFPGVWRDGGFSACIEHATPDAHALLFSRLQGAL